MWDIPDGEPVQNPENAAVVRLRLGIGAEEPALVLAASPDENWDSSTAIELTFPALRCGPFANAERRPLRCQDAGGGVVVVSGRPGQVSTAEPERATCK